MVSCGLLATLGDVFEALDLAHHLLDQGAPYKKVGEKLGLINRVGAMRDDWADAALSRSLPIAFRIIAFVSNDGSWIDVGAKTGQHFEIAAIARLAAFWYNLSPPLTMWT